MSQLDYNDDDAKDLIKLRFIDDASDHKSVSLDKQSIYICLFGLLVAVAKALIATDDV